MSTGCENTLSPSLRRDSQTDLEETRDSSIRSNEKPSDLPPLSVQRRAGEDIDPLSRHYRSVSVDSDFNDYLKLPLSWGNVSSTSLADGDENTCGLECRNEVYTADELKKISESTKLTEIASDPKKVKAILANRAAAARWKMRKAQYVSDLEDRVKFLKNENDLMGKKVENLEEENTLIMNEQKEIRIRLESLEQQAHIRDEIERLEATTTLIEQESEEARRLKEVQALNEQLRIEIQRMKIATGEVIQNDGRFDGSNMHQTDPNMFQQLTINEFDQRHTNPEQN